MNSTKQNNDIFSSFFLSMIFLVSTSYFLGDIFKNLYSSYFFALNFALVFIIYSMKTNKNVKWNDIIHLFTFIIYIIMDTLIISGGIGSAISIILSILTIYVFSEFDYTKKNLNILASLSLSFVVYIFVYSYLHGFGSEYIGSYNPNGIALAVLICSSFVNITLHEKTNNLYIKIIINLFLAVLFFYLRARISMLVFLALLIVIYFFDYKKMKGKTLKRLYWLVVFGGLIISYVYVLIYKMSDKGFINKIVLFSIEKFHKNIFTGREVIWGSIYDKLLLSPKSFLLGIGSHFENYQTIGTNFHNDYLSILLCFGFVGFLLFFTFIYRIISRILISNRIFSKRVVCTYLCLLIIGWFESDCFSWYFGMLSFIFLSIGGMEIKKHSSNVNENKNEMQIKKVNNINNQMIDFLIAYEVKKRELESDILIGNELMKRGYRVEYISFSDFRKRNNIQKYRNNVRILIMPSLYHDNQVYTMAYNLVGNAKMIINLRWEQVFTHKEDNLNNYVYPKGSAKDALHLCWGEKEKEDLVNSGLPSENAIVTGPVHLDFIRPMLRKFYIDKAELFQAYDIPMNKKTFLFISSFVIATMTDRQIAYEESQPGYDSLQELRVTTKKTYSIMLTWIEEFLIKNENVTFIYRPHPSENVTDELKRLLNTYQNLKIIGDYNIKQWIFYCDFVTTWQSTSLAEAYYAGINVAIIRPDEIRWFDELVTYDNAKFIVDKDLFVNCINSNQIFETTIDKDTFDMYYDFQETPSYLRIVDICINTLTDNNIHFKWDKDKIRKYRKINFRNFLYSCALKPYLFALMILSILNKVTKLPLSSSLLQRVENYRVAVKNRKSSTNDNDELQSITKRLSDLMDLEK